MKKLIASITGIVCLAVLCYSIGAVRAQSGAAEAAAPEIPHKVGLIDLGQVFSKYKKFDVLKEDLKTDVMQTEGKLKEAQESLMTIKQELTSGTYKEGSPEFTQKEKELTTKATEFESFRKVAQRDIQRKESKVYQTTYLEISEFVEKYAKHFQYTLILRFNKDELSSSDPQRLMQAMNRTVVYSRESEDITNHVIEYMNKSYETSQNSAGTRRTTPKKTGQGVERTSGTESGTKAAPKSTTPTRKAASQQ